MSESEDGNEQGRARLENIVREASVAIVAPDDDLSDHLNEVLWKEKLNFATPELLNDPAKLDFNKYSVIVALDSAEFLNNAPLKANCRVPVILVGEKVDREILAKDFNISDAVKIEKKQREKSLTLLTFAVRNAKYSYSIDSKLFAEAIRQAAYKKFEFDELCKAFPSIEQHINALEIRDEIHYVAEGNHGQTDEQKAKYWVRGRARQISKFDAAHLIALAQMEEIKQKGTKMEFAKLIATYDKLYTETKACYFEKKIKELFDYSDKKETGAWLLNAIDLKHENLEYLLGLWCAEHPQMIGNVGKITRHRNDVVEYMVGDSPGKYIFKMSQSKSDSLRKEKKIIDKFREFNESVKKSSRLKRYVNFPFVKKSIFSDEKGIDFLMIKKASGVPIYDYIIGLEDELKKATDAKKAAEISDDISATVEQEIAEIAKVSALGCAIKLKAPVFVNKAHCEKYYIEQVEKKFIGKPGVSEYSEFSGKSRYYPEFKGGLATILNDKSALDCTRDRILECASPIFKLVAGMKDGIFTDRSSKNILKSSRQMYMVDFETLRDMPLMFELAVALRGGLASEEECTLKEDLYFGKEKVAGEGEKMQRNKVYIAQFNNCLEDELAKVADAVKEKRLKEIKLAENFSEAVTHYNAVAAIYNMIGVGIFTRRMIIQGPSYVYGANKAFADLLANISHLHEHFKNDSLAQSKLNDLKQICSDIYTKDWEEFAKDYGQKT